MICEVVRISSLIIMNEETEAQRGYVQIHIIGKWQCWVQVSDPRSGFQI